MDLLDQLALEDVPPVPAAPAFDAGVRRRLHPRLLAAQLVEFALGATGWAAWHLLAALAAGLVYTVTGSWPRGRATRQGD